MTGFRPFLGVSAPNKLFSPAIPVYWVAARLHAFWLMARARPAPHLPLIVVGALRAGGSGKTSVTAALVSALGARGLKVGILAWRVGPGLGRGPAEAVAADADWRLWSDEAVLLARETGCPVFATRDRAAAWRQLARAARKDPAPFDVLVSDDGFQDLRLRGALRILLAAPGESPGFADLLPGGPFRETARARFRADLILEGPLPDAASAGFPAVPESVPPVHRFRRRFLAPASASGQAWVALSALGDARPFLSDLERAGIRPRAVVRGPNHGALPLRRLAAVLAGIPGARAICTAKEAVRLEGAALPTPAHPAVASQEIPHLAVAGQEILLDTRTLGFLMEFLDRREWKSAETKLVH